MAAVRRRRTAALLGTLAICLLPLTFWVPGASAQNTGEPGKPLDLRGFATGQVAHVSALETGGTRVLNTDVAWSGGRKPGADGKLPAVGNTVDVANATWTNTIGAPELITVWKDPDFDPAQRAFYYGRIIEIPTPRWTAYDAKYFGIQLPPEVPMTITERAYTSPIWYTPGQ